MLALEVAAQAGARGEAELTDEAAVRPPVWTTCSGAEGAWRQG